MIRSIPKLISALHVDPSPNILSRYRGHDWVNFAVPHTTITQCNLVLSDVWFLSLYRWPPLVATRIAWWQKYNHSVLPVKHPLVLDTESVHPYSLMTLDGETPMITSNFEEHNYSLHLFSTPRDPYLSDAQFMPVRTTSKLIADI